MRSLILLTVILVGSAPLECRLLFFGHSRWRSRATDYYARRSGLAWDSTAESFVPRIVQREIGWLIGSLLAYACAVVGILSWGMNSDIDMWLPGTLLIILGGGLGQIGAGLRHELRQTDVPRFARIDTPAVEDYVSPRICRWSRVGTPLGMAIIVIILACAVIDPWDRDGWSSLVFTMTVIALVLAVLAWVMQPVLSRLVLNQGQPARSPAELVWADAMRAETLSDLRLNPMAMTGFGIVAAASLVTEIVPTEGALDWSMLSYLIVSVVGLVIAAASATMSLSSDSRFYLVRLWPEIARVSSLLLDGGPGQPTRTMPQSDASESRPC